MPGFRLEMLTDRFWRMKRELPVQLANDAQRFFLMSFRKKGFTDQAFEAWDPHKHPKNPDNGLLVKTGALRRAVANSAHAGVATWDKITLVVPLKYAAIQNEGGIINRMGGPRTMSFSRRKGGGLRMTGNSGKRKIVAQAKVQVKPYEIHIPARPFMKHSEQLDKKLIARIEKAIDEVFNF